jgi:hypothetical protein
VRPTGEGARGTWQGRLRDASVCACAWENAEPREARVARTARQARRDVGQLENISQYPCSDAKISKKLNRSAQSGE